MHILNIGDRIPQGDFIIHSRFSSVVNYTNETSLLAWVQPEIGGGPNNIVGEFTPHELPDQFTISENRLTTPHYFLDLSKIHPYDSSVQIPKFDEDVLKASAKELIPIFCDTAPQKSIAFVLCEEKREGFDTSFEQKLKTRILTAAENIQKGQVIEGIHKLKGCGIGLTPSGDDYIAGYLSALGILKQIIKENLLPSQEIIYKEATGNNLLSNTFMYYAKEGRFYEAFKKFLICFLNNEKQLTFESLRKVQGLGATSGADFLSGFLHTVSSNL
jgi:hypothetical protein